MGKTKKRPDNLYSLITWKNYQTEAMSWWCWRSNSFTTRSKILKAKMHSAWEAEGGGSCSFSRSVGKCACVCTHACAGDVSLFHCSWQDPKYPRLLENRVSAGSQLSLFSLLDENSEEFSDSPRWGMMTLMANSFKNHHGNLMASCLCFGFVFCFSCTRSEN